MESVDRGDAPGGGSSFDLVRARREAERAAAKLEQAQRRADRAQQRLREALASSAATPGREIPGPAQDSRDVASPRAIATQMAIDGASREQAHERLAELFGELDYVQIEAQLEEVFESRPGLRRSRRIVRRRRRSEVS